MIMVLAGTNEGRKMAVALEQEGHNVIVSTATTYGGEILRREFSGEISSRHLNLEEMVILIKSRSISRVVDATHPYAVDVSANAREACRRTNIAYERFERAETELADLSEVIAVTGIQEALSIAASFEGIIFLTVGSSKLELYTAALGTDRLAVRKIDHEPAAAVLYFDYANRIWLYNSGYKTEYRTLSIGLISKILLIKDSITRGRQVFDFLKGREVYKSRLGGTPIPIYHLTLTIQ